MTQKLSMRIGRAWELDKISKSDIDMLAASFGMSARLVRSRTEDICDAVLSGIDGWSARFVDIYGASPAIERCKQAARKQAKGLRQRLA